MGSSVLAKEEQLRRQWPRRPFSAQVFCYDSRKGGKTQNPDAQKVTKILIEEHALILGVNLFFNNRLTSDRRKMTIVYLPCFGYWC